MSKKNLNLNLALIFIGTLVFGILEFQKNSLAEIFGKAVGCWLLAWALVNIVLFALEFNH